MIERLIQLAKANRGQPGYDALIQLIGVILWKKIRSSNHDQLSER